MYRLRERTRKTPRSGLGSPRNAHQGMFPVRCWHNRWPDSVVTWHRCYGSGSGGSVVKEAALLLHRHRQPYPSEAAAEEVLGVFFSPLSPHFYIFNLVTASLISLDLKPPRETGRERYRRKMRGKKPPVIL